MSFTQRARARIIAEAYRPWLKRGARVLDVGCGNGVASLVLTEALGLDLWGTDIIDYRKRPIPFKLMDSKDKLPFPNSSFDVVMFNDVLHHSECAEALLMDASRIAPTLLVFEDVPTALLRVLDKALNWHYCARMPCPNNFRSLPEWEGVYAGLGLRWTQGPVRYPFWYPIRHMAFCLLCGRARPQDEGFGRPGVANSCAT